MTIKTVSSRVVYRNRWMTVEEDEIVRENGAPGIYGVVSKPDFSLIIPRDAGCFHLVEQYRYAVKGRYIEFPQGSYENDLNATPEQVAAGELREETGLIAKRMTYLGRLFLAPGYSNQGVRIFLAEDLMPGPQQLEAEESDLLCKKVPCTEFEKLIERGEIMDSATVSAYCLLRLKDSGLQKEMR